MVPQRLGMRLLHRVFRVDARQGERLAQHGEFAFGKLRLRMRVRGNNVAVQREQPVSVALLRRSQRGVECIHVERMGGYGRLLAAPHDHPGLGWHEVGGEGHEGGFEGHGGKNLKFEI